MIDWRSIYYRWLRKGVDPFLASDYADQWEIRQAKRSEKVPESDEAHETTNDIIKFRSRMWCDGKTRDF